MGVFCYTSMPLQPFTPVTKLLPVNSCINPRLFSVHFFPPLTPRLFLTGFALKQHSPHAPELLISPVPRAAAPHTTSKAQDGRGRIPAFRKLSPCPISPLPRLLAALFSPQPATVPPVPVRPRRWRAEAPRDEPGRPPSAPGARLPQPGSLSTRPPFPFLPEPSPPARSPPGQPARHRALRHGTSSRR